MSTLRSALLAVVLEKNSSQMLNVRMYLSIVVFLAVAGISPNFAAEDIQLPYEVQETLLNLMTVDDLERINTADNHSIRPIYRKDLDTSYIAYYDVNNGKSFLVLSAGPKTGDKREVESGPLPSPSQVLIAQAEHVGQECSKFYRLATGLYMCENKHSVVVAATFDWDADSPVQDWRNLHQKVQNSLADLKTTWEKTAASTRNEWSTSQRISSHKDPSTALYYAELVTPGSTALVALENDFRNITIHAIEHQRQKQLCQILVKVCKDEKLGVNPELVQKLKNGISFIKIEIQEDKQFVRQVLRNQDVSFYIKFETRKGEKILKYFSVDLSAHRQRRWTLRREWSVTREDLFPDYNQHKCCGCESGCGPVAWAQILGYYDRLARYNTSLVNSTSFWTCSDGSANNCTAPKTMNADVERYVEKIRSTLGTFCLLGGGATTPRKMKRISNWYHARGIKGCIDSRYNPLSVVGVTYPSYKKSAVAWLKEDYPVILGIWTKGFSMHYAVATRYKEWQKTYRKCFLFICRTKTKVEGLFYMHMGWGGKSNGWYSINTFAVFSAKRN